MSGCIVVLSTVPDTDTGRRIARAILERRLAACVNISGPLEEAVRSLHPYDVPEIIALPVGQGSSAYLDWIGAETRRETG